MKYLDDQTMDQVSGGEMQFLPTFLVVGLNSPKEPKTVDAPVAALGGAQTAIGNIIVAGPGDIANISSPYAPV